MIRIIHLSDFHVVNHSSWNNMKVCLLQELQKIVDGSPEDSNLLVITGDFHNHDEKDYDKGIELIDTLVQILGLDISQDVFMIPGNHDQSLSEDKKKSIYEKGVIELVRNDINLLQDDDYVNALLELFSKYDSLCTQLNVYNDPNLIPASIHVRIWRNKLNIIHINTALASNGSSEKSELVDIKKLTSSSIRTLLSNKLPTIALGHNDYYDLDKKIQNEIYPFFGQEDVRAYLCGDKHRFPIEPMNKHIFLGTDYGDTSIPNIVCARTSTDEVDDYSDFGFYIHEWNEETGSVTIKKFIWKKEEQNKLYLDVQNNAYSLAINPESTKEVSTSVSKEEKTNIFDKQLEKAKTEYEKYIQRKCSEIELAGLPTKTEDLKRSYDLNRIFVPLSFSKYTSDEILLKVDDTTEKEEIENIESLFPDGANLTFDEYRQIFSFHTEIEDELSDYFPEDASTPISLCDLIPKDGTFRKILLADPGAGKTTLLKLIASFYCFPEKYTTEDIQLTKRALFPIWIRCRDIKDKNPSIWDIIDDIPCQGEWGTNRQTIDDFSNLVQMQIQAGNALLLIDGLDEIENDKSRTKFVEHLSSFLDNNPKTSVIISSRVKGFSIISNKAFCSYEQLSINSLSEQEIIELCVKWCRLVYGDTIEANEKTKEIAKQILDNSRLQILAQNPLMLTTLLLVERNWGRLPTKRAFLYQEAVQVLLATWNSEQHDKIDLMEAKHQLAYVAYAMSTRPKQKKENFTQIKQSDLLKLLHDVRKNFSQFVSSNSPTPEEFIRIVEQRSALLVKKGVVISKGAKKETVYEFQHLTFQEYLAAFAVSEWCYPSADTNNRDGKVLIPFIENSNMREIILLTAAIHAPSAHELAETAINAYKQAKGLSRVFLHALLLSFIADEVLLPDKDINRILDLCFRSGIKYSDLEKIKTINSGKNRKHLKNFFEKCDKDGFDGYASMLPIYQLISGEITNPITYYKSLELSRPNSLTAAIAVLDASYWLRNEYSSSAKEILKQKIFSWLKTPDWHVKMAALNSNYLKNNVKRGKQYTLYLNECIDCINTYGKVPYVNMIISNSEKEQWPNNLKVLQPDAFTKIAKKINYFCKEELYRRAISLIFLVIIAGDASYDYEEFFENINNFGKEIISDSHFIKLYSRTINNERIDNKIKSAISNYFGNHINDGAHNTK